MLAHPLYVVCADQLPYLGGDIHGAGGNFRVVHLRTAGMMVVTFVLTGRLYQYSVCVWCVWWHVWCGVCVWCVYVVWYVYVVWCVYVVCVWCMVCVWCGVCGVHAVCVYLYFRSHQTTFMDFVLDCLGVQYSRVLTSPGQAL